MPASVAPFEILAGGPDEPTQLLYFTTPSVTADRRTLVAVRDGEHPNLVAVDLATRAIRQLSANQDGTLKSYVYFRGRPHRGLSKASVSLDAVRRRLYYVQGDDVMVVSLDGGAPCPLLRLPAGQVTAFTHVSADGRRICIPTTDERALEDDTAAEVTHGENRVGGKRNEVITDKPAYDIDERVRREGLSSWLRVYDTETGALLREERVPQAWITHVQFSPVNSDWILYNHEWPSDCGIRRLWLWDGRVHRRLRTEGAGRSRADWSCHEMWESDGAGIIYHGKYANGRAFIGRVAAEGGEPVEITLPEAYQRYGHFTAGTQHNRWLVSDGYWHPDGAPENGLWGGEWITRLEVNWDRRHISWSPLCPHHSAWDCQDSHPHPVFGPGDDAVYFTSNLGGGRCVGRIKV